MQDPEQEQQGYDAGSAIEAESVDVCRLLFHPYLQDMSNPNHSPNPTIETLRTRVQCKLHGSPNDSRDQLLTLEKYRAGSLTETLSSQITRGVQEYGRTYAAYGNEG